jgi:hypothetical protein
MTQMGAGRMFSRPKVAMVQDVTSCRAGEKTVTRGRLGLDVLGAICVWRAVVCLTQRSSVERDTHWGAISHKENKGGWQLSLAVDEENKSDCQVFSA